TVCSEERVERVSTAKFAEMSRNTTGRYSGWMSFFISAFPLDLLRGRGCGESGACGTSIEPGAPPRDGTCATHDGSRCAPEMIPTFAPDVLPAPGADGHRGSRCDRSLTSGATFTRPRTPGCEPAMSRSSFYRGAHNKQALPVPATARRPRHRQMPHHATEGTLMTVAPPSHPSHRIRPIALGVVLPGLLMLA